MARKYIRRVSKVKNDDTKGYIINSTNVEDKEKNTYSANVIDKFNTYSTEEYFTGKYWINGKKIYGRVVDLGNMPNNAVKNVHIYVPNVEFLLPVHGCARGAVESISLPNAYSGSSQTYIDGITVQFSGNNISTVNIRSNSDRSSYTAYAILEYTKTTD